MILSILIEKYRKDKNGQSQVGWFVLLLCLVHRHSLELINSNSKLISKWINISITLYSLYWYWPYEFVYHYRVLRCTACTQIDRKHSHKSNNVTWLVSFSVIMSCSFQEIFSSTTQWVNRRTARSFSFEWKKNWGTPAKFVIIDFYRLL